MKKIENIIESCKDCCFCLRYKHPQEYRGTAFICDNTNPQRLILIDKSLERIDIPDWCPLETYKEAEESEVQPTAPADNCSTIILPGMPSLEWMTENLTGHGGTEIDGNWYYTWEQAMAAAKELGDGWRLSTAGELQQLCDLGSMWDGKRKGRWFGGNHNTDHVGSLFLPALGYLHASDGTVYYVGTYGYSWSSSPDSSSSTGAGGLYFGSGHVSPLLSAHRAHGLPVRCVREISERI